MTRYIAFLRGINVGGHHVKMEQLRELFTELGFNNVKSYINSGNIFFDSENIDKQDLTHKIEERLYITLGYEVPTFLRTTKELESILSQDAFRGIELNNERRLSVIFTNQPINTGASLSLPQFSSKNDMEMVAINTYEAFVVWHIINHRPPSGRFSENIIPPKNTLRFYHTLAKILVAAISE